MATGNKAITATGWTEVTELTALAGSTVYLQARNHGLDYALAASAPTGSPAATGNHIDEIYDMHPVPIGASDKVYVYGPTAISWTVE